jgi:beta-lactamase superfamily II metal-dependent hydrolase
MAEEFEIKYFYMGQGDCILIVCPNGKLVMIDCGSAKGLGANSKELLNVCFDVRRYTRKNKRKIDHLILTHKDRDHYNQVRDVFSLRSFVNSTKKPLHRIKADTVYFSSPAAPSANYAITQFTENGCGNAIIGHTYQTNTIKQVFINSTEQKVLTYTKATNFLLASGTTTQLKGMKLGLLSGTTAGGKKWSVSIIAGQVPETPQKQGQPKLDPTNALSLVTLLEIDNSKALFLGDATLATESFLMNFRKALIQNVEFVHIPHHGSRTSSGKNFVKIVNPKGAEVTHETFETGNRLPKQDVLKRWQVKLLLQEKTDDHALDYWQELSAKQYDQILASWKKKNYPIEKRARVAFMLKIPKGFKNDFVCIYKTVTQYWGLYRAKTDLNLWGTGADDFNEWTLPLTYPDLSSVPQGESTEEEL